MSGFTKLVPEIIQSSIWNEPSDIRIVWITLLAVKDATGYVRGDSRTISRLANVPLESVEAAMQYFMSPDPLSHTPDHEGRRIGKADGGWIVLNHDKYRGRDAKADHAEYVRQWRAKKAATKKTVTQCDSQVNHPSVSASEQERGCKGETSKARPENVEAVIVMMKNLGMPKSEAYTWMDHYTSNGWRVGKNPMKDWAAAVRTWHKRWLDKQSNSNLFTNPSNRTKVQPAASYAELQAQLQAQENT